MANPPNIAVRGIRQVLPTGYVIGRTSPGSGDAELIPLSSLGQALVATGTTSGGGGSAPASIRQAYLGFVLEGPFALDKQFIGAVSHAAITFPSATIASSAQALVAPTGNFTIYLVDDLAAFISSGAPAGCLANIDFTTASTAGTVTWYGSGTFASGTVPYICFPHDFDVTLAQVVLLFAGDII